VPVKRPLIMLVPKAGELLLIGFCFWILCRVSSRLG
jgi:hypothetical protein